MLNFYNSNWTDGQQETHSDDLSCETRSSTGSLADDELEDSFNSECVCPCCAMVGPPSQPLEVEQLRLAYSYQSQHLRRKKNTLG